MSKHSTREILESGGIVEGEVFELMLKEESQSEVIKELKEINQHLMDIKILMGYKDKLYCDSNIIDENKKEYKQNSNDIDIELYLESIKSNKTLFNAEIFLDRILNVELCKMLNILYLECKNECGYFNKEMFMTMRENLYNKILNDCKINKLEQFDDFNDHGIVIAELMAEYYKANNFYDNIQDIKLANELDGTSHNIKFNGHRNQSAVLRYPI